MSIKITTLPDDTTHITFKRCLDTTTDSNGLLLEPNLVYQEQQEEPWYKWIFNLITFSLFWFLVVFVGSLTIGVIYVWLKTVI
jgi:hypothetical protein